MRTKWLPSSSSSVTDGKLRSEIDHAARWFFPVIVSRSPLATRLTSGVNAACGVADAGASAAGVAGAGAAVGPSERAGFDAPFPDRDNQTPSAINSAAATIPTPAQTTG